MVGADEITDLWRMGSLFTTSSDSEVLGWETYNQWDQISPICQNSLGNIMRVCSAFYLHFSIKRKLPPAGFEQRTTTIEGNFALPCAAAVSLILTMELFGKRR